MINILIYFRFILLWSILVAVILFIYYGLRNYVADDPSKFKKKVIFSGISVFAIPIFIIFYNLFLVNIILSDIKDKVKSGLANNATVLVNNKKDVLSIGEIDTLIKGLDFWLSRNHSHNEEEYEITIIQPKNKYQFSFYKDSGVYSKYYLYTNQYNYELELASIKTDVFDKIAKKLNDPKN